MPVISGGIGRSEKCELEVILKAIAKIRHNLLLYQSGA
jgi:hypothetical protein